ncbi:MAG: hypothetical protein U1F10_08355 [Burkholderiales bacterium]
MPAPAGAEARTAAYFARIRDDPQRLVPFLRAMPKGGDLHNHASGAVYAESLLQWAVEDGLCVDTAALALRAAPCDAAAGHPPLADALARDGGLHDRLVDALSMRHLDKSPKDGHTQFFDTFGKFDAATKARGADVIAAAVAQAGAGNLQYVELMVNPDGGLARRAGQRVGWSGDFAATRAALLAAPPAGSDAHSIPDIVAGTSRWLDGAEARRRDLLRCDGGLPDPGCAVTVRYLYQGLRALPPELVFAQLVFAFEWARADPRVVGVNLVQPEDAPAALANFRLQMRMLDYLHGVYPDVRISLHAGELAPGLVPPDALRFHVRESVTVGHANRIGHGVSVMQEDDAWGLLRELARRDVLVEVCLTSNDGILGVRGRAHPLRTLLASGVPVALATDDAGVNRSDITGEYQRAVLDQKVDYAELKAMARASLTHAFVAGESLWRDPRRARPVAACARDVGRPEAVAPACRSLLAASARARLQFDLEARLAAFEAQVAADAARGMR